MEALLIFLKYILYLIWGAIIARVMLSWLNPGRPPTNPVANFIHQITEPILSPIRRIIPRVGLFDLTPMIAMIIISALIAILERAR